MANYTSSATVVVEINGRQAKDMLKQLENSAAHLQKEIERVAAAGDKAGTERLRKELKLVNRDIDTLRKGAQSVEEVLSSLDKASPKELRRTLRTLKSELNGIERGSDAWNAHIEQIRRVRAELDSVNGSMKNHRSAWEKITASAKNFAGSFLGAAAGITGITAIANNSVKAYAEMEQEMANVRKYTGMTAEEVKALNEELKKIDTRSSREELNRLAQEAGRLGKTSQEDVLGFVRAADKINVALDDLGEGATLTLSKLTGIFGDEERLGTEKALLSVGSVINELSQNCSASAPYLAEFASRMGGVGSQAGMTVQQIMGFGAVLDSNNQAVEAASTALSQVIVRMYADPAKYAKAAGLEVEQFSRLVRTDMNAALIQLLSTLNSAGGMDVLSPMFKDMGENGSRAISALSTLSKHIDEVKAQQEAANVAFEEANSIDKEFAVQNGTVAAEMDKAKKKMHEMAVELGEKLQPLMKHIHSALSALLGVISSVVTFMHNHKGAVIAVAAAYTAYRLRLSAIESGLFSAQKRTALLTHSTNLLKAALTPFNLLFAGISTAISYFTNGLKANRDAQIRWNATTQAVPRIMSAATISVKAFGAALKATPIGWIITGVTAVISVFTSLFGHTETLREKYEKLVDAAKRVSSETIKEEHDLAELVGTMKGAKEGSQEYESAKNAIISQYGQYLQGLIDEEGKILDLEAAYDRLTLAIRRSAKEKALQAAEDNINQKYFNDTAGSLTLLQDKLEEWGATAEEAARIKTAVAQAIASEKDIPQDIADAIDQYSEVKGFFKQMSYAHNEKLNGFALTDWLVKDQDMVKPNDVVDFIEQSRAERDRSMQTVNDMRGGISTYYGATDDLQTSINNLTKVIDGGQAANAKFLNSDNKLSNRTVTPDEARALIKEFSEELIYRQGSRANTVSEFIVEGNVAEPGANESTPMHTPAPKASDRFTEEKNWKAMQEVLALIAKQQGKTTNETGEVVPYTSYDYQKDVDQIQIDYYKRILKREDVVGTERLEMTAKLNDAIIKQQRDFNAKTIDEENNTHAENERQIRQSYIDDLISSEEMNRQIEDEELRHLGVIRDIYKEIAESRAEVSDGESAADDYRQANDNYNRKVASRKSKQEASEKKSAESDNAKREQMRSEYFGDNAAALKAKFDAEIALLDQVKEAEIAAAGESAEERKRIEEAYQIARLAIAKKYQQEEGEESKNVFSKANEWLQSDGGKALTGTISTLSSGMSSIFSQVSAGIQADLEKQTAAIEKRYDTEISNAEGNSYKVKKLEEKKQKEIAKAKNEASRKEYAMQVIQAVAQTAQNALAAYGSAAAIPVVGHAMAPIAAAMAVAAGMLQVQALKKQQQAAESQGYSEGGFTRPGRIDEPAGIVHAGEWVASQKLVNNPKTRPLLEALDYAQRTNTIGSITNADVSRRITAPMSIASRAETKVIVEKETTPVVVEQNGEYADAMRRLVQRLEEPFVTVNTVNGEYGINQAQEKYNRLMSNKSRKR